MADSVINLLVIDDDDINIFIIRKIVEKTGYKVNMVSRSNGQLAVEYLTEIADNRDVFPQLMLVDINMPILNGWEFLEAYEQLNLPQKSDMYMLSSSVYENDIEKAKSYKTIKGFISKPLTIERLSELLRLVTP
ncbi:response regulator [Pedobacter frigoris]|uniref:Response regulator n=1 Tax=Pedobacter frigoris TaxID=2571272 RepID=A0A4U1CE28_9SPHI|nr:response regulator [Pedobacter frigoris]TKC04378.1 response regulator [Pedobacter frigoris]